jgi:hypothetical protein
MALASRFHGVLTVLKIIFAKYAANREVYLLKTCLYVSCTARLVLVAAGFPPLQLSIRHAPYLHYVLFRFSTDAGRRFNVNMQFHFFFGGWKGRF